MAKFISLINYSSDAMSGFSDLGERLAAGREAAASHGITIDAYYLTLGQYDAVAIVDAPDSAAVAKLLLTMGGAGRFSTVTLAAFSEEEAVEIASDLG